MKRSINAGQHICYGNMETGIVVIVCVKLRADDVESSAFLLYFGRKEIHNGKEKSEESSHL